MNYSITLYNFSKRTNSTKRPSGSGIGTYVCSLIEPTSIHNPVITLHLNDISPLLNANYAKFGDEFYYIEDIVVNTNTEVEFRLEKDVLASFNTQIRNTTAFIELSTSNYDTDINDTRIGATDEWSHYFDAQGGDIGSTYYSRVVGDSGAYLLSIAGLNKSTGDSVNPMSQVICSVDSMEDIVNSMYDMEFIEAMNSTYTNGLKDALQSITYIPYDVSKFLRSVDYSTRNDIRFGGRTITLTHSVKVLSSNIFTPLASYSLPYMRSAFDLEDYLTRDFRDGSDYLKLRLYLPMGDNIDIDASMIYGYQYIVVITRADILGGTLSYAVYASDAETSSEDDMHLIYTTDVPTSIQIPFGAVDTNYRGIMRLGGAVLHNMTKGFGGNGFNFGEYNEPLLQLRATLTGQQNTQVSSGGSAEGSNIKALTRGGRIVLEVMKRELLIEPHELADRYGRPCNKIHRIGDLSGFVKTQGCSVSANAPRSEIESVNSLVNGGIYLE